TFLVLALLPLAPAMVLARGALALPRPHPSPVRASPGGIAELLRDRRLRRVFAINGLLSVAWDLHTFFIPVYGAKIGLSASRIGMILASFAAATFAVRLLMPWIVRRFSEFGVLTAAMFTGGCTYAMFPFVTGIWPLMTLSFILGLALGSCQPMVMSLLHSLAPAGRMGEAVGVRMSVINASTFAVPLFFGAIGSSLGIGPVFWLVGVTLAGGSFLTRRS